MHMDRTIPAAFVRAPPLDANHGSYYNPYNSSLTLQTSTHRCIKLFGDPLSEFKDGPRNHVRSVHTLKKRGRIVTGQVRSGQKGQLRGSSKIVAALTFPKLAQLCTGQVRAARAGFQKLFRPHELETHLT